MAFRVALGLPKNSSARVGWLISNQNSIEHRTLLKTDKFISKIVQLKQNNIRNKLNNAYRISDKKGRAKRNIPFIIQRWAKIKELTNELYKWDIHPELSSRPDVDLSPELFDLNLGFLEKNCGDPNRTFRNLINFHSSSTEETLIYTDGSKLIRQDGSPSTGAACWIPSLNIVRKYKLNSLSSSFTAEAMAIVNALGIVTELKLVNAIICTDSLSTLEALKSGKNKKYKLCPLITDIKYKIHNLKTVANFCLKLTWCLSHVGIEGNEKADVEVKAAAESGLDTRNKVDPIDTIN